MQRFQWLYSRRYVATCFLLATLAGALNAGGFIACHRAVSHVTGFVTQFGSELGSGHPGTAIAFLTVPIFFVLGALLSGYLVDRKRDKGLFEGYETPLWMVTFLIGVVVAAGNLGYFGVFGEQLDLARDYAFLSLLCLCCGMLNAVVSSATGSLVRVTHLTGMATDIGVGISRVVQPRLHGEPLQREKLLLMFRIGLIFAFVGGSLVGTLIFLRYQYWGFMFPGVLAAYSALSSRAFLAQDHQRR